MLGLIAVYRVENTVVNCFQEIVYECAFENRTLDVNQNNNKEGEKEEASGIENINR